VLPASVAPILDEGEIIAVADGKAVDLERVELDFVPRVLVVVGLVRVAADRIAAGRDADHGWVDDGGGWQRWKPLAVHARSELKGLQDRLVVLMSTGKEGRCPVTAIDAGSSGDGDLWRQSHPGPTRAANRRSPRAVPRL
jgi:hypothetical protein